MTDDTELLRRYAEEGVESAFAELVQRHLNLVYSAALRQLNGDAHLAADAAQLVFTDLARKARFLSGHRVLTGWLFTSTRYAAANLVRSERRRQAREQEALQMENLTKDETAAALDWERVRPVLDDVMNELGRGDREAVLLRFFEGRDYAEVGARMNLSANTARMRVERALEKLRSRLEQRGVVSTGAALAAALAAQAVAAAPAGLATTVTGAALAGASAGTGTLAAIFMSMTKLQLGVSGALLVAGATGFVVQADGNGDLRREIAALEAHSQVVAQLKGENQRLARQASEVAELRRDDAEFARLRDEAAALQAKLRAEAAARAARAALPLTGEIFDIARVERTPAPKSQARPQFPAELRRAGIGGEAVVDFVVDGEGLVRNAKAISSKLEPAKEAGKGSNFVVQGVGTPGGGGTVPNGASLLEAAALEAVKKWQFAPGEKDGRKVNTRMRVPIVFTLAESASGPAPTLWF